MSTSTMIFSAPDQYQKMLENYASILEKTNSQLSLWSNPYSIMIAILTFLIAILALVVSFLLWKHSDDQKKRVKEFFDKQEKIIKERSDREDKLLKERQENIQKLITEYQEKLKTTTSDGKEKIEKFIRELEEKKASVSTNVSTLGYNQLFNDNYSDFRDIGVGYVDLDWTKMICANCGKEFRYYLNKNPYSLCITALENERKVYCTFCGSANLAQ